VLKNKRSLPPRMLEAEKQIEQWRDSLLLRVHPRLDIAIYLLVSTTCYAIGYQSGRLMPHGASNLEMYTRGKLFGLQFALSDLEGDAPQGRFVEDLIVDSLRGEDGSRAFDAVTQMAAYGYVRDAFLTYAWGGYEIESPAENVLRFVDAPDWGGTRDRAEQIIGQEIKGEQGRSFTPPLIASTQRLLEERVEIYPQLPLGGLTSAQFVSAWMGLALHFSRDWLTGKCSVTERDAIVAMAEGAADLNASEAERFVSLVTFDRKGSAALTLFHCPLVPVTTSSVMAVAPGFIFGNPAACIPRLAVHRGPGLDAYAKDIAAHLLDKLRNHFRANGVTINTNLLYSGEDDRGDIDLVVYESGSNRLLIAQAKAFVVPDTVEEVVRANQALEEGLNQASRVRRWLEKLEVNAWGAALKVPLCSMPPRIQFAVIGNGFAGSDYLAIPEDIAVVDSGYLLLSRFAGRSIFDAIDAYQRRLSEETSRTVEDLGTSSFTLAGITIELPSWSVSV